MLVLLPSLVLAASPRLLSVGNTGGKVTARWSLPPRHTSDLVEVSRTADTARDGSFRGPFVFTDVLRPHQQSWTSDVEFASGTYFVHVSACDPEDVACLGRDRWSNIRKLVLRTRDRYFGKTRQGKQIRFTVSPSGTKVEGLHLSYRGSCQLGSFSGELRFRTPVRVRAGGRFSATGRFASAIDRGSVFIEGRLLGYGEAIGSLRARVSRSPAGRCDSGKVRWEAITRTF
jgi:hypothetical protein